MTARAGTGRLIAGFLHTTTFLGTVAVLWLASRLYTPLLASARTWCIPLAIALAVGTVLAAVTALRRSQAGFRVFGWSLFVAAIAAAFVLASVLARTHHVRTRVLAADPALLAVVGRHVMIGYRDIAELKPLIARGAVGGVFVTARNAQGKSVAELRSEIDALQSISKAAGRPPLIIATDQEGGLVSRLSPPLPRPVSLARIVGETADPMERLAKVRQHARSVGQDLASVGVGLNFAPLADLDFGIRNPADRLSRIGERAISADPVVAGAVARAYCEGLAAEHVTCTLKHFPGLGRVAVDTHWEGANLDVPLDTLASHDWRPFRAAASSGGAIMVGHVRLGRPDKQGPPLPPASTSRQVIDGILRREWAFDGLIVTDDLNMYAIFDLPGGIGAAAVASLDAGADLLLVSYDPDQVYPVLDALLGAIAERRLDPTRLEASRRRLVGFHERRR